MNSSTLCTKLPDSLLVIGIAGFAGVGKDTAASILRELCDEDIDSPYIHPPSIKHFADPLKSVCAEKYCIDLNKFNLPHLKNEVHSYWGVTPRQILQFEGTECARDTVPKLIPGMQYGFWVHRLAREIVGGWYTKSVIIIPDVRFEDEYSWITSQTRHFMIHLTRDARPDIVGISNHRSEKPLLLKGIKNEVTVENNGTIEDLKDKLHAVYQIIKANT